jgi:hypothetical protein
VSVIRSSAAAGLLWSRSFSKELTMLCRASAVVAAGALGFVVIFGSLSLVSACSSSPGDGSEQNAVIGGAGSGATLGNPTKGKPLFGGLTNGADGAYLIGANWDLIEANDSVSAGKAIEKARSSPALPQEARNATTIDINNDGFTTIDEVVATQKAGFSDDEMIRRLELTGQVFDLSQQNINDLKNQGVSQRVIDAMKSMNRGSAGNGSPGRPE